MILNKGSQGREEKRIYFTDSIEEALIKYIRTERSKYDPQGYTRLDQLDAADSIFLTAAGTPYTRSAFYYHWYSLLKRVQSRFHLAFSPHDLRHLHVTRNIARIEQKAKGDQQLEAQLREGFWRLMGWSSAETMEIYIHVLKKRQALLEIVLAEDESVSASISPNASSVGVAQRDPSSPVQLPPQESNISFEEDDLSWYEE